MNNKSLIVRLINNKIDAIFDNVKAKELTTVKIPDLIKCKGICSVETRMYHMSEVISSGLPIKVDHDRIQKYFFVHDMISGGFRYYVSDDGSFSCVEVSTPRGNKYIVLTYDNEVLKSSFTISVGLYTKTKKVMSHV